MKKEYIKPISEVILMRSESEILAASGDVNNNIQFKNYNSELDTDEQTIYDL